MTSKRGYGRVRHRRRHDPEAFQRPRHAGQVHARISAQRVEWFRRGSRPAIRTPATRSAADASRAARRYDRRLTGWPEFGPEATIGRAIPRREGRAKVTGQARYIDDLTLPGMLHGVTVRSPVARGHPPRHQSTTRRSLGRVHHRHRRRHPRAQRRRADRRRSALPRRRPRQSRRRAGRAARARRSAPARGSAPPRHDRHRAAAGRVHDRRGARARSDVIWGDGQHLQDATCVARGDVDAALADAAVDRRGRVRDRRAGAALHRAERHARGRRPDDGVTVWGSMQCPYYVHKALAGCSACRAEKIRVVQMETGGGFGGKEEYPSMIAGHAALLAWKSGRPVKIDLRPRRGHGRRRPSATRRGRGTGPAVDARRPARSRWTSTSSIDGGAYCTLSPVVLSRGTIHAAGPYFCPNVRDPRPRRGDQRAAARRVPRLRRAAEHLRARAAHGSRRRRRRPRAGGVPPPQLHQARADERRRPGDARAGRHGRAARSRAGAVRTTTRSARGSPRANARRARQARASGSRRSCTAPASPARARITSRRS